MRLFPVLLLSACFVASSWAIPLSHIPTINNHRGGDLSCVIGEPAGLCLQDTGLLRPRVALVCKIFVISDHLVSRGCEDLGFPCPKETPRSPPNNPIPGVLFSVTPGLSRKALPHNSTWEKLMFGGLKAFANRLTLILTLTPIGGLQAFENRTVDGSCPNRTETELRAAWAPLLLSSPMMDIDPSTRVGEYSSRHRNPES